MTEQQNRKNVLTALGTIGLTCESMHHFVWRKKTKQIEISLSMDIPLYLEGSTEEYTTEQKEGWYTYERYNVDKICVEFKKEEILKEDRRMIFSVDYVLGQEEPIEVYVLDEYYKNVSEPYDIEWVELLNKYGYEECVQQKELVEIFDKEEGNRVVKNAMLDLESEMAITKNWIEKQVAKQIKELLDNL